MRIACVLLVTGVLFSTVGVVGLFTATSGADMKGENEAATMHPQAESPASAPNWTPAASTACPVPGIAGAQAALGTHNDAELAAAMILVQMLRQASQGGLTD